MKHIKNFSTLLFIYKKEKNITLVFILFVVEVAGVTLFPTLFSSSDTNF